ncbi:MAG TPA: hypothetical protein V6D27_08895 [Vampirovibrionales bacterium]
MLLIYPSPGGGESIRGGNLSGIVSIPSGLAAVVVGRNCAGGNRGHRAVGSWWRISGGSCDRLKVGFPWISAGSGSYLASDRRYCSL